MRRTGWMAAALLAGGLAACGSGGGNEVVSGSPEAPTSKDITLKAVDLGDVRGQMFRLGASTATAQVPVLVRPDPNSVSVGVIDVVEGSFADLGTPKDAQIADAQVAMSDSWVVLAASVCSDKVVEGDTGPECVGDSQATVFGRQVGEQGAKDGWSETPVKDTEFPYIVSVSGDRALVRLSSVEPGGDNPQLDIDLASGRAQEAPAFGSNTARCSNSTEPAMTFPTSDRPVEAVLPTTDGAKGPTAAVPSAAQPLLRAIPPNVDCWSSGSLLLVPGTYAENDGPGGPAPAGLPVETEGAESTQPQSVPDRDAAVYDLGNPEITAVALGRDEIVDFQSSGEAWAVGFDRELVVKQPASSALVRVKVPVNRYLQLVADGLAIATFSDDGKLESIETAAFR